MSVKAGGTGTGPVGPAGAVSGNSMPPASIAVPAGYCQIFSEYLDLAVGVVADIQLTAILEIT